MDISSRAIAIHAYPFRDTGRILKVLTEEKGMVSILLRSASSKQGRSTLNLFQPMYRLGVVVRPPKSGDLFQLSEVWLHDSATMPSHDHLRCLLRMFYAEVILRLFQESEGDTELFEELWQWMELNEQFSDLRHLPILFLLRMTHHFGVAIPKHEKQGFFDLKEGHFHHFRPLHNEHLDMEQSALLQAYLLADMSNLSSVSTAGRHLRQDILDGLVLYLQLHVEHFKGLRSIEVLTTVLDA